MNDDSLPARLRQLAKEMTEGDPKTAAMLILAAKALSSPGEAVWRSPKDKPPHLPGEHHSEDVLIVMKGWSGKPSCRIGHVSLGNYILNSLTP